MVVFIIARGKSRLARLRVARAAAAFGRVVTAEYLRTKVASYLYALCQSGPRPQTRPRLVKLQIHEVKRLLFLFGFHLDLKDAWAWDSARARRRLAIPGQDVGIHVSSSVEKLFVPPIDRLFVDTERELAGLRIKIGLRWNEGIDVP